MDFTASGGFIFSAEGDLWVGEIREDVIHPAPGDKKSSPKVFSILEAYRHAPLATRETAEGTPAQMGARSVAVSSRHAYAHLRRMGGSGLGEVVRISLPKLSHDEHGYLDLLFEPVDRAKSTAAALSALESLGFQGQRAAFLCASADDEAVYFTTSGPDGGTHWLARGEGAPQAIKVQE